MQQEKIKKYYLRLSLINLILALVFLLIPGDQDISERIKTAISVYLMFHLTYQIISRFYIWAFENFAEKSSAKTNLHIKFLIGFSLIIMILPFASSVLILYSVIFEKTYQDVFNLIFLSGVFLGGSSMNSKFKDKLAYKKTYR